MSDAIAPQIDAEDVGEVTVARVLAREVRHPEVAAALGAQLRALVEQYGRRRIVVDLAASRYFSSTGFAALMGLGRSLRVHGGRIALCNVHPDMLVGARIIGLEQIAPIFDGEREAVAHVSS